VSGDARGNVNERERACDECRSTTSGSLKRCPCLEVLYCSTQCQDSAWPGHREKCKASRAAAKSRESSHATVPEEAASGATDAEGLKAVKNATDEAALVAAMRRHAGNEEVQDLACDVLSTMVINSVEKVTRARNAGAIEAIVAAMRAHADSARLQVHACMVLCAHVLVSGALCEVNLDRARSAGALEAAVAAMRRHMGDKEVLTSVCPLLGFLTKSNEENRTMAAKAGAIEALVETMRVHPKSSQVQLHACGCLYFINIDNAENVSRAKSEGVKEAVKAALMAHSGDELFKAQATALAIQICDPRVD